MSDDDLEMFSFSLGDTDEGAAGAGADTPAEPPTDADAPHDRARDDGASPEDAFSALAALAGLDVEPADDDGPDPDDEPAAARPTRDADPAEHVPMDYFSSGDDDGTGWTVREAGDDDAPWTAVSTTDDDEPAPDPAPLLEASFDRHEPVEDIAAAEDLLDQLLAEARAAEAGGPDAADGPDDDLDDESDDVASSAPAPRPQVAEAPPPTAGRQDDEPQGFSVAEDDEDDGALAWSMLTDDGPRAAARRSAPAVPDEPLDGPFTFSVGGEDDDGAADAAPAADAPAATGAGHDRPAPARDEEPLDGPFSFVVGDDEAAPPATPAPEPAAPEPAPHPAGVAARPSSPPDEDLLDGPFTFAVGGDDPDDPAEDDAPATPSAAATPPATAAPPAPATPVAEHGADDAAGPRDDGVVWSLQDEDDAPVAAPVPPPLASGWGSTDDDRWGDADGGWSAPATTEAVPAQPAPTADDDWDDFADLLEPDSPAPAAAAAPAARAGGGGGTDGLDHLDDLALLFEQVAELDDEPDPLATAPPPRLEDAVRLDDEPAPEVPDPEVTRAATEGGFTAGDNAGRSRRGLFRR